MLMIWGVEKKVKRVKLQQEGEYKVMTSIISATLKNEVRADGGFSLSATITQRLLWCAQHLSRKLKRGELGLCCCYMM